MMVKVLHACLVLALTVLTQVGGIAYVIALGFRRRFWAFVLVYVALSLVATQTAPLFGRVPVPCLGEGALQMRSPVFWALNRGYVTPELLAVSQDMAAHQADQHPGTVTQVLDAGFPFITGFPLLPHLSHDDGTKADIAFWYAQEGNFLPGATRSPLGYFAFEQGPTDCPPAWLTLRWDMAWLQPIWPDYDLDEGRTRTALTWLAANDRVDKVFIEPHLRDRLGLQGQKIRFQGCRAGRHDDHIHIQM